MTLRTVRVPEEIEGPFRDAEEVVSRYFANASSNPERGTYEISGERYILVRAASLSVEFFSLVADLYGPGREREGDQFARNILFDLAHAIGKSDAQNFHTRMGLVDPIARLSAGPVHFSHTGWAFVDIDAASRPEPNDNFYLIYNHPYSFESDAWLGAGKRRLFPVCIMNAGYSSGWCEASFGITLVATEVQCRARGDANCRFVMAPPHRIESYLEQFRQAEHLPDSERAAHQIPDFFARKRAEDELRRAHADLERRVDERTTELRESNEQLRHEMAERQRVEQQLRSAHKLEAIGRLAGGVAHDFNTLLGVIMGNAGLLSRRLGDDDTTRPFVDSILQSCDRAAELTRQLLAFGRAQPRGDEVLDVNQIVGEIVRMLRRLIGENIDVDVSLGDGVCAVQLARVHFEQVVMNLLVNARDAMPAGGRITVQTRTEELSPLEAADIGALPPGAYVALIVTDDGIGMSDDVVARMFEPYFTTKDTTSSSGLGLATVYGIVRNAGGGIKVRTTPGAGSTFAVYFPATRATPRTATVSDRPPATVPERARILVVEDQAALRRVVAEVLRAEGHEVIEADDPASALAQVVPAHPPFDLLVTDVVMPGMSGPQLALRMLADAPKMRVLYMSGYTEDETLLRGTSGLGGVSLLVKPFTLDTLTKRVRAVLDEPA